MMCHQPFLAENDNATNIASISEMQKKSPYEYVNQSHWLKGNQIPNILTPELALPLAPGCLISRNQAALNMLSCLDTLAQSSDATDFNLSQMLSMETEENEFRGPFKGQRQGGIGSTTGTGSIGGRTYTKEDYSIVNRFDSHGGGWGYSGHSIEAIRIMSDTDVLLGGLDSSEDEENTSEKLSYSTLEWTEETRKEMGIYWQSRKRLHMNAEHVKSSLFYSTNLLC